jgi:predicted amidohydrolase
VEVVRDLDVNLDAVARLTEAAVAGGATLVVWPESTIWPIDADSAELAEAARAVETRVLPTMRALASRTKVTLVVGLLEPAPIAGKVFNSVHVFSSEGDVGSYRKIHLYDAFGTCESDRFVAGPVEPFVFTADGFTVGVMTCYDLRFPELARELVDREVAVILVPAAWAQGPLKEQHWDVLLRARAVENTCYVAAADQCGAGYAGRSTIIDPLGVTIAGLAEAEGFAIADVDQTRLDDVRKRLPVLANRRLG